MKTTHELARELLSLPDVRVVIELWCSMEGYEPTAIMTDYDSHTAIIVQRPTFFAKLTDTQPTKRVCQP